MAFNINHMTPALFGEGTSLQTGERLKTLGCKKVLAVYDQGVKQAGITDKILENINEQEIEILGSVVWKDTKFKEILYGLCFDQKSYSVDELLDELKFYARNNK